MRRGICAGSERRWERENGGFIIWCWYTIFYSFNKLSVGQALRIQKGHRAWLEGQIICHQGLERGTNKVFWEEDFREEQSSRTAWKRKHLCPDRKIQGGSIEGVREDRSKDMELRMLRGLKNSGSIHLIGGGMG